MLVAISIRHVVGEDDKIIRERYAERPFCFTPRECFSHSGEAATSRQLSI